MVSRTPDATTSPPDRHHFPAYGPIEGVFGVALFYVIVDRATPLLVSVSSELLPGVAASTIRTATAAAIWFVVAVTVVDQLRRQLAALGVTRHALVAREARRPGLLGARRVLGYGVLFLLGLLYVGLVWESALETAVELVPIVAFQDVDAFDARAFVVMVTFFVAYGLVARALDRMLIGSVRYALAEGVDEE